MNWLQFIPGLISLIEQIVAMFSGGQKPVPTPVANPQTNEDHLMAAHYHLSQIK